MSLLEMARTIPSVEHTHQQSYRHLQQCKQYQSVTTIHHNQKADSEFERNIHNAHICIDSHMLMSHY